MVPLIFRLLRHLNQMVGNGQLALRDASDGSQWLEWDEDGVPFSVAPTWPELATTPFDPQYRRRLEEAASVDEVPDPVEGDLVSQLFQQGVWTPEAWSTWLHSPMIDLWSTAIRDIGWDVLGPMLQLDHPPLLGLLALFHLSYGPMEPDVHLETLRQAYANLLVFPAPPEGVVLIYPDLGWSKATRP